MLLLNYDFYDIHATLLHFRNDPSCVHNIKTAESLKHLIDSPQTDNVTAPNTVRRRLAEMNCLDKDKWNSSLFNEIPKK